MSKASPRLTSTEYESLDRETLKDLNLITKFYYDVIRSEGHRGIIKKVTPRQFYEFIKRNKKDSKSCEKLPAL